MKGFTYSVTFEFDGETQPNHCKGRVDATSPATAASRAIREAKTKGQSRRAGSIVIVLTPVK